LRDELGDAYGPSGPANLRTSNESDYLRRVPVARRRVEAAVCHLASPAAASVTGTALAVDGRRGRPEAALEGL